MKLFKSLFSCFFKTQPIKKNNKKIKEKQLDDNKIYSLNSTDIREIDDFVNSMFEDCKITKDINTDIVDLVFDEISFS